MRVREVMSVPVAAVAPNDSLHVADGTMSLGGVRHLVVVSGGELVGVVSERDILRAPGLLAPVDGGLAIDARAALKILRVGDVMSSPAITVHGDTPVAEAAALLVDHRVGCLPVLEDGTPVGIVTTSDLLRAVARDLATAQPALDVAPAPAAPGHGSAARPADRDRLRGTSVMAVR
jgi:acetoin utilization protein AcuB